MEKSNPTVMKEIIITQASINDADMIQALGKQIYSETFAPHNTTENLEAYLNKAFSPEQILKELSEENSQWYVSFFDSEPTGFIKINFGSAQTELQDARSMEIERIYVLEKFQGYRIGKQLMEKAIAIARNHNLNYVWLSVWEKNTKAMDFYKRYGFDVFDQHSFFVGDDEQKDWLMKLVLKN